MWPAPGARPYRKATVKFCIEVGEAKKHQIEYEFNQLLGRVVIKLNQQEVKRNIRLFNEPVKETHLVQVDAIEHVAVRIEKVRRQLVGCKCLVFLNERLFRCYDGF